MNTNPNAEKMLPTQNQVEEVKGEPTKTPKRRRQASTPPKKIAQAEDKGFLNKTKDNVEKAKNFLYIKNMPGIAKATLFERAKVLKEAFPKIRENKVFPFGTLRIKFDSKKDLDEAFNSSAYIQGQKVSVERHEAKGLKLAIKKLPTGIPQEILEEELKAAGLNFTSWEWRNKRGTPRATLLVTLQDQSLYNKTLSKGRVLLFQTQFRVEKTLSIKPVQCFNCQKFGHSSITCTGQTKCRTCSLEHRSKDCPKGLKKCANCMGDHCSTALICPKGVGKKNNKTISSSVSLPNPYKVKNVRPKSTVKKSQESKQLHLDETSISPSKTRSGLTYSDAAKNGIADKPKANMQSVATLSVGDLKNIIQDSIEVKMGKFISDIFKILKKNKQEKAIEILSVELGLKKDSPIEGIEQITDLELNPKSKKRGTSKRIQKKPLIKESTNSKDKSSPKKEDVL
ncbi:Nucleic-acid-binding protein from mobile element jockey [Nosema granulosis]|uniref:Nucleic-acid-binding protein from mobile element jockey n=1 Tax=Nosema granulosis TaxID=83296 RepID=A0A9P6KXK7_9MICR|nr:Nucleic-acid-binding protein from mobile element jockey [Nosema granulosis]